MIRNVGISVIFLLLINVIFCYAEGGNFSSDGSIGCTIFEQALKDDIASLDSLLIGNRIDIESIKQHTDNWGFSMRNSSKSIYQFFFDINNIFVIQILKKVEEEYLIIDSVSFRKKANEYISAGLIQIDDQYYWDYIFILNEESNTVAKLYSVDMLSMKIIPIDARNARYIREG
jgi:hypothetical protein